MSRFVDMLTNFAVIVLATAITASSIGISLLITGFIWLGVTSVWGMIF